MCCVDVGEQVHISAQVQISLCGLGLTAISQPTVPHRVFMRCKCSLGVKTGSRYHSVPVASTEAKPPFSYCSSMKQHLPFFETHLCSFHTGHMVEWSHDFSVVLGACSVANGWHWFPLEAPSIVCALFNVYLSLKVAAVSILQIRRWDSLLSLANKLGQLIIPQNLSNLYLGEGWHINPEMNKN